MSRKGRVPEAWERPCDAFRWILRPWRPFWTHFGPFLTILGQTDYLRLEHCDIGTVESSETSTLCVETKQMSVVATEEMPVLATEEMFTVEKGQMSAVERGQMSAVETGQMSAVETRQASSAETRQM